MFSEFFEIAMILLLIMDPLANIFITNSLLKILNKNIGLKYY